MKIQNLGDVLSDEFTTVALIIGFLGIIFTLVVLSTIILSGENLWILKMKKMIKEMSIWA